MPTKIVSQIIVTEKDQEPVEFFVSADKKHVVVKNVSDDATAFSFIIGRQDWDKVSKFIDSKLK